MSSRPEEQYDKIYRYCYFRVRDAVRAEDLTQETFLRYFARRSSAGDFPDRDGEDELRYLYRIAHNLCVDSYRTDGRDLLSGG